MATGEIISRLHLLIDRCIRRYAEGEVNSSTEEMEKDMIFLCRSCLISFVQQEKGEDTAASALDGPESKDDICLERLMADLVGLLGVKNVQVQHLAGNILVEVSESLVESGSQWDDFIRLLCDSLRLAVIYSCPVTAVSSTSGSEIPDLHFFGSDVLKSKMQKSSWCTVSAIFRVLLNILKRLSQEENEELIDVYLESVNSTLAKVPWCRVDAIFSHQYGSDERNSQGHNGTLGSVASSEEVTVFLESFVQFLCSVVHQARFADDSDGFEPTRLILQKPLSLFRISSVGANQS